MAVTGMLLSFLSSSAWACPTCKDGLGENYVSAYAASIVFMMSVPYLILLSFAAYVVYALRWKRTSVESAAREEYLATLAEEKARQGIPTQPPAMDG